jgi:hypothetical protein
MPANKKFQGDFFPDKEGTQQKFKLSPNFLKQDSKSEKTQLQIEKSLLHKNSKNM